MARENTKIPGIEESRRFLRLEVIFNKVGLAVLLCIIVMALAGVFSGGYLSANLIKNKTGNVILHFERFNRLQTPFTLKISSTSYHSGKSVFRLGGDFTTFYETDNIWPQPDSMYSEGDNLYLVYHTEESQHNPSIWLQITPVKPGSAQSILQLNSEPEIQFRQFIYP